MYEEYWMVEILPWVRPVRLRQFPKHTDSTDSRDSSRWYKWPRRWTYSPGLHPVFCVKSVDFRQHIQRPTSFHHQVRSTHRSPARSTASEMWQHGGRCTDRLRKKCRLRVYFFKYLMYKLARTILNFNYTSLTIKRF